jgi:hypothetical protein
MVRLSPDARFIRLGASNGRHIFPEDAVELDGKAAAYVGGAKLREILEAAKGPVNVDDLIARWMAHMPLERARRMFGWACAEGWIEAAGRSVTSDAAEASEVLTERQFSLGELST